LRKNNKTGKTMRKFGVYVTVTSKKTHWVEVEVESNDPAEAERAACHRVAKLTNQEPFHDRDGTRVTSFVREPVMEASFEQLHTSVPEPLKEVVNG
jgi:hypothetical protein